MNISRHSNTSIAESYFNQNQSPPDGLQNNHESNIHVYKWPVANSIPSQGNVEIVDLSRNRAPQYTAESVQLKKGYAELYRKFLEATDRRKQLLEENILLKEQNERAEQRAIKAERAKFETEIKLQSRNKMIEDRDAKIRTKQQYTPFFIDTLEKKNKKIQLNNEDLKSKVKYQASEIKTLQQWMIEKNVQSSVTSKKLYWALYSLTKLSEESTDIANDAADLDRERLHDFFQQQDGLARSQYETFQNESKLKFQLSRTKMPTFDQWIEIEDAIDFPDEPPASPAKKIPVSRTNKRKRGAIEPTQLERDGALLEMLIS